MRAKIENLEIKNIEKSFEAIKALKDFSAKMEKGNIYGIIGENGAGKTTLMKILNGALIPDKGEILINGENVRFHSPKEACEHGIGMVYQELYILPNLNVTENVFVSQLTNKKFGYINWKILREKTKEYMKQLDIDIDPDVKLDQLRVAHQQIIAIIRALALNCSVLILDEPTSSLTLKDIESLFKVVKKLKELGLIIIYVSHKLDEILSLTDEIIALRNGEKIGTFKPNSITKAELVELVAGRKLDSKFPKKYFNKGEEILRFNNVSVPGILENISFSLYKGKVLGFAGLLGAGKSEIAKVLFGIFGKEYTGKIYLHGKEFFPYNPKHVIKNGIGLVPENRTKEGLIVEHSVYINTIIAAIKKFSNFFGVINFKKSKKRVYRLIDEMNIKCNNLDDTIESLSGGNQQKVVLAKWLAAESAIVIFDEPTRGIDVGAKVEVYNIINDLVSKGIGVIIMSSENDEVLNMSDSVVILKDCKISAIVNSSEMTEDALRMVM